MSETRKCHMEYSGDTGYGGIMGKTMVCEEAQPKKVEEIAPAADSEEASGASTYTMDECYGLTGIGGVFISMLWRHARSK